MKRDNVKVITKAHTNRVLFEGDRAIGIEYLKKGKLHIVKANKEVILSAGAINSPQLLMLSGVGPRVHLEELGLPVIEDSLGVGQNLQDHIAVGGLVFPIDYKVSISHSG